MRIGMLLSSNSALYRPGDGTVVQAKQQAAALEALGHEVVRMESWDSCPQDAIDVLHVFHGGFGNFVMMAERPMGYRRIILAPFIDSNMPFWLYRMAASVRLGTRLYSVQHVLRRQGLNCDIMIARSRHERERFVRGLGIPASKVAIVLNGVSPARQVGKSEIAEVHSRFNLPERFILNVGMYTQTRKNALRLAQAAESLGYPLVFAGTTQPGIILDRLKAMATGGKVWLLGFLDRPTLEALHASCEVFALPSIHEGTGLAALDAASYGAKVVITRNGGPPDYFADLVEYTDPYSVGDIARALRAAWEAPRTAALQRHVTENLTWRSSAEQLIAAYAQ